MIGTNNSFFEEIIFFVKTIRAIKYDGDGTIIKHFDERYVQFFERAMDILFTRLTSSEVKHF